MEKIKQNFEYLINKSKKEVLEDFGDAFNCHAHDELGVFYK